MMWHSTDGGHGGTTIQTVSITLVGTSDLATKTPGGAKGGGKSAANANDADDGSHSIFDD